MQPIGRSAPWLRKPARRTLQSVGECVRPATTSRRKLQAVHRSALCGQGAKHRRAVPVTTEPGYSPMCRLEIPNSGTESLAIGNDTTSLLAALDIASGAVIGKCYKRHRAAEFLEFLKTLTGTCLRELICNRHGQLRHTQDAEDQGLAGPPRALACPLYPHFGQLDQSGRTLVRRVDPKKATTSRAPLCGRTGTRYRSLHRHSQ